MTCALISKARINTGFINEYEPPYCDIKKELEHEIWKLYCEGYTDFYSNCEYGQPLWAAEIVCSLRLQHEIRLHIVTPYEEQAVNWCEEFRDRYFAVHEQANTVEIHSHHYYESCYEDADKIMVSRSDRTVILNME